MTSDLIKLDLSEYAGFLGPERNTYPDQKVLALDLLLHQAWEQVKGGHQIISGNQPVAIEDLAALHAFVKRAVVQRGLRHITADGLEGQTPALSFIDKKAQSCRDINAEEASPNDVEKGLYFPIMGGLKPYREKILPFPEHKTYVEVFCGCGEMIWEKEPSETEIMTDIDPEIVFLHGFCKRLTESQVTALRRRNWVANKQQYERLKKSNPKNEIDRFHRNLYLRSFSRQSSVWNKNTFRPPDTGRVYNFDRVLKAKDRLKNVRIERSDWRDTLKKFDSSKTLFFLDPPYEDKEQYYTHGMIDYVDLAEQLKRVRGKFVFVVKLNPETVEAYKDFYVDRFYWQHRLSRINNKIPTKSIAYVIRNFKTSVSKSISIPGSPTSIEKQISEEVQVPPEEQSYQYVIQHHWRGRTVHADFRVETANKDLAGWTIADMHPDVVQEPVETIEAAKKWSDDGAPFKIDFKSGLFQERKTAEGSVVAAQLRAFPKGEHSHDWLSTEGLTPPFPAPGATPQYRGVFVIEDQGICEYGAQKGDVHEYFLHGKLKGRFVFRRLSMDLFQGTKKAAVETDEETSNGELWMAIQPYDQTPLVLSDREIVHGWLPPHGISALPAAVREQVPAEFQYWKVDNVAEAIKVRAALVESIKSGVVAILADKAEPEKTVAPTGPMPSTVTETVLTEEWRVDLEKAAPFHIFGRFTGRVFNSILKSFPDHSTYAEAFSGPAQFFHSKDRSEVEVLADKDRHIVSLHRTIRDLSPTDFKKLSRLQWGKLSKSRFQELAQKEFSDPLHELWRVIILKRNSIGHGLDFGKKAHYRDEPIANFKSGILGRLQKANERLLNAKIYQSDFEKTIKAWDSNDSFFILDPPFFERDSFYGIGFSLEDIQRLCKTVRQVKGKFMLIHTPTKSFDLEKELSDFHCHRFVWNSPMQHLGGKENYESRKLLVFWNYGKKDLIKSNLPYSIIGLFA